MSSEELIVSNSSPLIWLAKVGRLKLLKNLFNSIIIPRSVFEETTSSDSADSILIGKAIEAGWIKVSEEGLLEEADILSERTGIHTGEAEAILLAQKLGLDLIIDEREGTATAQVFDVKPIGTLGILLLALVQGHINYNELKDCIDSLTTKGFWLTVDVYNKMLEEAKSIDEKKLREQR